MVTAVQAATGEHEVTLRVRQVAYPHNLERTVPTDPTGPLDAAREEQIRQSQLGSQPDATAGGPRPPLSNAAQGLVDLRRDLIRDMGQVYQRPEEAYQRLTTLDDVGRERMVRDPSTLGPLREGAQPSEERMRGYAAGGKSHEMASPEAQREVAAVDQANARTPQNPMERQMGNALTINQSQLSI